MGAPGEKDTEEEGVERVIRGLDFISEFSPR